MPISRSPRPLPLLVLRAVGRRLLRAGVRLVVTAAIVVAATTVAARFAPFRGEDGYFDDRSLEQVLAENSTNLVHTRWIQVERGPGFRYTLEHKGRREHDLRGRLDHSRALATLGWPFSMFEVHVDRYNTSPDDRLRLMGPESVRGWMWGDGLLLPRPAGGENAVVTFSAFGLLGNAVVAYAAFGAAGCLRRSIAARWRQFRSEIQSGASSPGGRGSGLSPAAM